LGEIILLAADEAEFKLFKKAFFTGHKGTKAQSFLCIFLVAQLYEASSLRMVMLSPPGDMI
jgi:hypothetical protein